MRTFCFLFLIAMGAAGCSEKNVTGTPPPVTPPVNTEVDYYITKGDQSVLLAKQQVPLVFHSNTNQHSTITVDTAKQYQQMVGFGYTFTGGSAELIGALAPATKNALLQELFGTGEHSIGVSYLRLSIGASDLSSQVFTYDDIPSGQTDPSLQNFSL